MLKNYVLDITFHGPDGPSCFVPIKDDMETILIGLAYLSDKCPGNLVGVIHQDGQHAVEQWITKNPNWHALYSNQ